MFHIHTETEMEEQMNLCRWCHTPIKQKDDGSWVHENGFYQCPGSRSEYDLATPEEEEKVCVDGDAI
jgi:hypothetical protein